MGYLISLHSKLSAIVLGIFERLPRLLRVWILISIFPFGFSYFIAVGYSYYLTFHLIMG